MGMPNIPDIQPNIDINREDVVNLLLASIALEEIGLSHLINAEGEKLQRVIDDENATVDQLLEVNRNVEKSLRGVTKKEMLLQFKLEDTMELFNDENGKKC
ncbi:hypothetical protein [Texcoconibacillus texcoconensis]|uniref:Uncharacterized protein n=1 Tax=Texcoconibacillus texcoconensis TaxID=1095777 RepID=A0A840QQP9_9BACI|nr:hypothetical protein [Texcoconibacillus texcoconensis]MBB5173627.1 hypothetical protein [Texcoconibacillus texcoconensis]